MQLDRMLQMIIVIQIIIIIITSIIIHPVIAARPPRRAMNPLFCRLINSGNQAFPLPGASYVLTFVLLYSCPLLYFSSLAQVLFMSQLLYFGTFVLLYLEFCIFLLFFPRLGDTYVLTFVLLYSRSSRLLYFFFYFSSLCQVLFIS